GLGHRRWRDVAPYVCAHIVGAIGGTVLANLMFGETVISISSRDRLTLGSALGEVVATAGLITVIFLLARTGRGQWVAAVVAAWIGSAYFFTSSTSFANPAISVGRIFSDTFAGISPGSALGFIGAEIVGAALGLILIRMLTPALPSAGGDARPV
ncbi:MAG: aquaporin family protein, partial [Pseudolysinimonas sp.]